MQLVQIFEGHKFLLFSLITCTPLTFSSFSVCKIIHKIKPMILESKIVKMLHSQYIAPSKICASMVQQATL